MLNLVERVRKNLRWNYLKRTRLPNSYSFGTTSYVSSSPGGQKKKLTELFHEEAESLQNLDRDGYTQEAILGPGEKGPIRTCEARSLYAIIRHFDFKNILDIGTGPGWSALHFCRALKDNGHEPGCAHVDSIDIRDIYTHPSSTLEILKRDGLERYFHFHHGKSEDILPTLTGPYDLCLIDGDHFYEQIRLEWSSLQGKTHPGTIIAFHDVYDRPEGSRLGPGCFLKELKKYGRDVDYFATDIFDYFCVREDKHAVVRILKKWEKHNYTYVKKGWDPRCLMAITTI